MPKMKNRLLNHVFSRYRKRGRGRGREGGGRKRQRECIRLFFKIA